MGGEHEGDALPTFGLFRRGAVSCGPPFKMIRAVLFDYSGVFTTFPFLSLEPELLTLFWGDYGDVEANHAWHRLERGEISLLAERNRVARTATLGIRGS